MSKIRIFFKQDCIEFFQEYPYSRINLLLAQNLIKTFDFEKKRTTSQKTYTHLITL